jgi:hypothetical protein
MSAPQQKLAEHQNGVSNDKEFKHCSDSMNASSIIFKINIKEIAILIKF